MPDFRCNMLDEHGHMLFPAEIVAENLDAAIQHASVILRASNQSSSSRRILFIRSLGRQGPTVPAPGERKV